MHKRIGESHNDYRERANLYIKTWRRKNKDRLLKETAQRRAVMREDIREYMRNWRAKNRVKYNGYCKKFNKNPCARARKTEWARRKYNTDLNFRITSVLRQRVYSVLVGKTKSASTLKLLGCDVAFLRLYLAAKFTDGMNWGNYGKWHIDHYIPLAEFDLTKADQQGQAFHYSNLQPLWGKDNLIKGCKVPAVHQPELL